MYVVARGHVESFSSLRMRVLWYAQVMAISTLSLCFERLVCNITLAVKPHAYRYTVELSPQNFQFVPFKVM